jgi:hypothetical protein
VGGLWGEWKFVKWVSKDANLEVGQGRVAFYAADGSAQKAVSEWHRVSAENETQQKSDSADRAQAVAKADAQRRANSL